MYFGDDLASARYPHLHHIVQTKFKAHRGINMFKDLAVYATTNYSSYSLPDNHADDEAWLAFKDGQQNSYTSSELA